MATTSLNDLPDAILSSIIAAVSHVRSRNSASLVCRKWYLLERSTRSSLTLRGNLRDLFKVPTCFSSISHLDLSLLSPWGHPLTATSDPALTAHLLRIAFHSLTSLTLYARNPSTIQLVASQWPLLQHLKLVRWHQRPQNAAVGDELRILFSYCPALKSLDLSAFYCWTDDLPPALESHPSVASNLTSLNLLNPSFSEGFKSDEIKIIAKACPNMKEFRAACVFDPRYIGFVGDEALVSISMYCPKLALLHLAETSALSNARGDLESDGFAPEDARINVATLIEVFSGLPLLEHLTLDICNNVRDSGPALEILNSKCPKLRSLKLGQFHGISMPVESNLDGVALCQSLESLSIRNVGDLTDIGLIAIARGCCRLVKFEIHGCKNISMRGMRTFTCLLHRTLVNVKISCCKKLGAVSSLKALDPIRSRIEQLHIDCIWGCDEEAEDFHGNGLSIDLNSLDQVEALNQGIDLALPRKGFGSSSYENELGYDDMNNCSRKKFKYSYDPYSSYAGEDVYENGNGYIERTWDRLQCLSLWIPVGEVLTPLTSSGLENCPNLEEIKMKIEGDCRELSRPSDGGFGLSTLLAYPRLTRMHMDCGDVIGYAHTAPSGRMDLSLWERFYLFGIGHLDTLTELDYWPPQDRDVNQRSLSLPAAGLLWECIGLRKLFIHGTTHEHFMKDLLRIKKLRDVQLRGDYYPAPENDMSTEMRADSCSRFEDALLNRGQIPD